MHIHIGNKIREVTELRGISKSELARRLNMTSTNVHKIFKRESIDTQLLFNLSNILEHNFFLHYVNEINIKSTKEISGLDDLESCIDRLRKSEKINSLLIEKIESLESKLNH